MHYNTMLCFIAIALFALVPLVSSKAYCTYHMYQSTDSLTTVACSDGANGIMTKFGYGNINPMFPYVAAFSGATWNSPNCGRCVSVTANSGKTVYLTVIDQCGGPPGGYDAHFDIAPPAFRELFGDAGVNAGVQDAQWKFVAANLCKGNKGSGGGSNPPPPPPPPPPSNGGGNHAIRCGSSWGDANGKCGTLCTNDGPCGGGRCYADLNTAPCNRAESDDSNFAFEAVEEELFVDAAVDPSDEYVDAAVFDAAVGDQVFEEGVNEFYDPAIVDGVFDAATAPTDSALASSSSSGVQGWVIGLLVLFSVITVLLVVVVIQIIAALRK